MSTFQMQAVREITEVGEIPQCRVDLRVQFRLRHLRVNRQLGPTLERPEVSMETCLHRHPLHSNQLMTNLENFKIF